MLNKLPFIITGSARGFNPSSGEPYRVGWNTTAQNSNKPEYISLETSGIYRSKIKCLYVETDYDPLVTMPFIRSTLNDPLISGSFSSSTIVAILSEENLPEQPSPALLVPNIIEIANPDRRNKLPKVFFARIYANAHDIESVYAFKYNLKVDGSEYAALMIWRSGDVLTGMIELKLNGSGLMQSDLVTLDTKNNSIDSLTELRFVIFDDHLAVYTSEPGTQKVTLSIPRPLMAERSATLAILQPEEGAEQVAGGGSLGIDGLIIYDGYF